MNSLNVKVPLSDNMKLEELVIKRSSLFNAVFLYHLYDVVDSTIVVFTMQCSCLDEPGVTIIDLDGGDTSTNRVEVVHLAVERRKRNA